MNEAHRISPLVYHHLLLHYYYLQHSLAEAAASYAAAVTALREELETAFREREIAIQTATRNLANEHAELRETVQMLRNKVDAQTSGTVQR